MKKFYFITVLFMMVANLCAAKDYGFKMLNVSINSDHYQSQSSGKAWSYDPSANVLHLKDGTITTTISQALLIQIDGDVNPTLTIQVDGNCDLRGTFSVAFCFKGSGKHTICGNGTLTMISNLTNPQVILSYGNTSLTIKDVTINIEAWGSAAVGLVSNNFYEVVLDYCEMNIKTSGLAWAAIGGNGVSPVLKRCFLSNGVFSGTGNAYNNVDGNLKEAYIKRSTCVVSVNVDEPVVGNSPSFNCTANSNEYTATTVEWYWYNGGNNVKMSENYKYQMGETYYVMMIITKADGYRFADREYVTAYVNGKEAEIYSMGGDFITLKYTFPALVGTSYDLWVGGKQVNDANKDNVLDNGKVTYNSATNTLTLKYGTIQGNNTESSTDIKSGSGIYSEISGLTINTQGDINVEGASNYAGMYLKGNTIVTGNGTINFVGYNGILLGNTIQSLTICGNVYLRAFGTVATGLSGYKGVPKWTYYSTLTIKDNATVQAAGASGKISIGDWKEIILGNGFAVTTPAGAVWNADEHAVCDASGNPIAGELVVIKRLGALKGDVNCDNSRWRSSPECNGWPVSSRQSRCKQ